MIRNGAVTQKPANPTERRKEGEKGYLAKLVENMTDDEIQEALQDFEDLNYDGAVIH